MCYNVEMNNNGILLFIYCFVGFHPVWDTTLEFDVQVPDLAIVSFRVMDYENISSNVLIAQNCLRFSSLQQGKYEYIGVNRSAIVREIPHFGLLPAFLREHPAFLALFRNIKNG